MDDPRRSAAMVAHPEVSPWFYRPSPRPGASLRLFCFPYAGGSSRVYQGWCRQLPATVELVALELPGRGRRFRDPLPTVLDEVVGEINDAIRPLRDRPFVFFGHSMGALMIFELARLMQRDGDRGPTRLIVSGRPAPQLPGPTLKRHTLPTDEFVGELRDLAGTPPALLENSELLELMVPILRADFRMCETHPYEPGAPLSCSISAYGGQDDPATPPEDLMAWREQTTGGFRLELFPGEHFFIHRHESVVLAKLSGELRELGA